MGAMSLAHDDQREEARLYYKSRLGRVYLSDSLGFVNDQVSPASVDLIVTSPPFGLVRKKEYGNVNADEYLGWFEPFGETFERVLKPAGSLVLDIDGTWIPAQPKRRPLLTKAKGGIRHPYA